MGISLSFKIIIILGSLQQCHSHLPLPPQPIAFIGKKCTYNEVHTYNDVISRGGDASTDEAVTDVIYNNTTEIEAISNRLKREEIQKVRDAQKFLKKQQMRREKVSLARCVVYGTLSCNIICQD